MEHEINKLTRNKLACFIREIRQDKTLYRSLVPIRNSTDTRTPEEKINDTVIRCWYLMDLQERAITKGALLPTMMFTDEIKGLVRVLVAYQNKNYYTRLNMDNKNGITADDIRHAKEFPFKDLIEVKNGMARCPFHEDKDPSFRIKNNYGHCFGGSCNWQGDPIDFIMKLEGLSFVDSVKRLQ